MALQIVPGLAQSEPCRGSVDWIGCSFSLSLLTPLTPLLSAGSRGLARLCTCLNALSAVAFLTGVCSVTAIQSCG